jgi:hypothetical protein
MINKIYKRIHIKFSKFFQFIFFIRHLFTIFFVSLSIFLIIPNFFDYKKKSEIIKIYLSESYGLDVESLENIKFNSLPVPNFEIQNSIMKLNSSKIGIKTKKIQIYPKLINIYTYKNFKANKVILSESKISLEINDLKTLGKYIYKLDNRIILNNLDLNVQKKKKTLINLKKINYSNFGSKKNVILGEIFKKKFKTTISNNFKEIKFYLLNTGSSIDFNLNENQKKSLLNGIVKIKVFNTNIKFSFDYDDKQLKIYKSYFRNKNLSFKNESIVVYHPFFDIKSSFNIDNINIDSLKNINLKKLIDSKDIIKKINMKNTLIYDPKKFTKGLIDHLKLNFNLAYGRLTFSKNFNISKNFFKCKGDTNLIEEYPIINFNCSINSNDKKNLLRQFSMKYKNKNEPFNLNVRGNLNILNNKINFKNVQLDKNYEASTEDLKYFKNKFETILLEKNFLKAFSLVKIKEFIFEIS